MACVGSFREIVDGGNSGWGIDGRIFACLVVVL